MFETKKTLIVVYKDELLMNQLKKMVETHDDSDEGIVGTRDDSINIVSWTEKVWMGNKKAGNIQGKILFLGDIKGTDKLIPVLDVKFDDCGVKYGSSSVYMKKKGSALSNVMLLQYLPKMKIASLELVGVDGNYCITKTVLEGVKKGFTILCNECLCLNICVQNMHYLAVKKRLKKINSGSYY